MFCPWMCCAVWLVAQAWCFMLTSPTSRYEVESRSCQTSSLTVISDGAEQECEVHLF